MRKVGAFSRAGLRAPKPTLSLREAQDMASQLDFSSTESVLDGIDRLKLQPGAVEPVMRAIASQSRTKALRFAKAVLSKRSRGADGGTLGRALLSFGKSGDEDSKALVCQAFVQKRMGVALVHGLGELPTEAAKPFMKSFLQNGGTVSDVAQWLQIAGEVLRQHASTKRGTDGFIADAWDAVSNWVSEAVNTVAETVSNAVDAVVDMVATVVDAVVSAGRTVLDVFTEAASWTADRVRDLTRALVEAGESIAGILSDAIQIGGAFLCSVVEAAYRAGAQLIEILSDVASATFNVVRTTLDGLLRAGVKLVDMIGDIVMNVAEEFRKGFFEGLLALAIAPFDLMKAAAGFGAAVLCTAFTVLMEVFGGHRPLTAAERVEAERVFGSSIDLDRVKIAERSMPADLINLLNGQRPFTTMYIINFASWQKVTMGVLIHELTHVWQGVTAGPLYMVEALHGQIFGRNYTVDDTDLAAAKGDLLKLEREQQAVVVEGYWRGRWGGERIDWRKYEPLAKQVRRGPLALPQGYSPEAPIYSLQPIQPFVLLDPDRRKISASPVFVISESRSGRNQRFWDPVGQVELTQYGFAKAVARGDYSHYYVRTIGGVPTPASKPNRSLLDNLG